MERIPDDSDDERLAAMLHALGNPFRLAMLRHINAHPGCICNDLVVHFGRAQATVSQHLATLRQANVVLVERDGQATCYWIDTEQLTWLEQQLGTIIARQEG